MLEVSANDFLRELYVGCDRGEIVFVGPTRNFVTGYFPVTDIEAAAAHVLKQPADLFIKVNVMDHSKTLANNPSGIGGKEQVAAVVSFHLDVDAKSKNGLKYTDQAALLDALGSMPLSPSNIILTDGPDGGLHAYWLLDRPHYITDEADRQRCGAMAQRWLEELRLKVKAIDENATVDGTANLDRLLRPIGSRRKNGNIVGAMKWNPERRYALDAFTLPPLVDNSAVDWSQPRFEGESVIDRYLNAIGHNSVEAVLGAQGYQRWNGSDRFLIRPGSGSGVYTGEMHTLQDGRQGFTVKSGGADPLSCANPRGGTGNWYSVPSLWLSFKYNVDANKNKEVWIRGAAECHQFFEPKHDSSASMHSVSGKPLSPTTEDLFIYPQTVGQLIKKFPELRPPVIDGILRQGETANLIASPKVGKSWKGVNLAYCVATGRPWLSHDVRQGRVLIIDNELHEETIAHRLDVVGNKMQIPNADREMVEVISLRGVGLDMNNLKARLKIEPGRYALIILDALYRTIPQGVSENDNAAMMAIYNQLDHYASDWKSAIIVIHHSSKGTQGEKGVTDVGAGAGSISRAADTHMVIREHESEGLCVFEAATRSFKSPEAVSIKFDWPLWNAVTVAAELKNARPRSKKADDEKDSKELLEKIPLKPKAIQRTKLKGGFDFSQDRFNRLVGKLIRGKEIKRVTKGRAVYFQRLSSETSSETSSSIQESEQ